MVVTYYADCYSKKYSIRFCHSGHNNYFAHLNIDSIFCFTKRFCILSEKKNKKPGKTLSAFEHSVN